MTAASWVAGADDSPFPLSNLPYGVFSTRGGPRRVGVAIGDRILDLGALARCERRTESDALSAPTLNPFLALGPDA